MALYFAAAVDTKQLVTHVYRPAQISYKPRYQNVTQMPQVRNILLYQQKEK
jgi:hypothetical protein